MSTNLEKNRWCLAIASRLLLRCFFFLTMFVASNCALDPSWGRGLAAQEVVNPTPNENQQPDAEGEPIEGLDSARDLAEAQSPEPPVEGVSEEVAKEGEESEEDDEKTKPLITNDAVIFGILMVMLGFVFWSSNSRWAPFKFFYSVIPMLLMCYFLPSLLTLGKVVDPEESKIHFVASRYLLPASLVLLTLSVDLKAILGLGPKALIMFITGTVGVVLGGPVAVLIIQLVAPDIVAGEGSDEVWRGLSTVAGSWIGGGANQTAMKEIFQPSKDLFSVMVTIDVLVAEVWMMFLLMGIGKSRKIDEAFGADASSIERLKEKMENYQLENARNPTATDLMVMLGAAFGATGISHFGADLIAPRMQSLKQSYPILSQMSLDSSFFWLIVLATTIGVGISFTPLRRLEGAGASKLGTVFIFILVATIGMQMNLRAVFSEAGLFIVGAIWMLFHIGLMFLVAKLIRAPYFFLAVGSKANIGGAASAPVVAAAFHPALAPVGVLLAVLGYVLGTYGAWLCAIMMRNVSF